MIFFSGKHSKSRRPNSASSDHANSDSVNLKRGGPDSMNMKSESSSSAACDKVPNNINESPSSSLAAASGAVSGAGHNISSSSSASSSSSGKTLKTFSQEFFFSRIGLEWEFCHVTYQLNVFLEEFIFR